MCQPQAQPLMAHRVMRRSIIHPQTQELLDDALAVYFPHGVVHRAGYVGATSTR